MDTMFRVTGLCWCFAFHALQLADETIRSRSLAMFALFGVWVTSGSGRSLELAWWPVASVVSRFGWLVLLLERRSMLVDDGVLAETGVGDRASRSFPILTLSAGVDCRRRWCICGLCVCMSSWIGDMCGIRVHRYETKSPPMPKGPARNVSSPTDYDNAVFGPYGPHWRPAIQAEIDSLFKCDVW